MRFEPFYIESFMSAWEPAAQINFAESGVDPVKFGELLSFAGLRSNAMRHVPLNYPEVNGAAELRQLIADLYEDVHRDQVLVTVGASEANAIIPATLLEPGDEVVAIMPTYLQLPGNAHNLGAQVIPVPLIEEQGWRLDGDMLAKAVTERTKIISVVNPNNPTGAILTGEEMDAIVRAADHVGAWIVADEVYAGAERTREDSPRSFWGLSERVIVVNGLSKAYGLPGLRCGWIVAPPDLTQDLWRRHEYATISASMLANKLAGLALKPSVRAKLIGRTRSLIREGYDILSTALAAEGDLFSVVPPEASAMAFVRFDLDTDSFTFAEELCRRHGVLVVPGRCFGFDSHLRISSALPADIVREGVGYLTSFAKSF